MTVAQSIAAAPNLTTWAAAVMSADLTSTLAGPGPVTVFAPTDRAFARLAPATVTALLKPENKPALIKLVKLHFVSGTLSSGELTRRIAAGGGRATLFSMAGEPLVLTLTRTVITLTDSGGNRSYLETADQRRANGVLHIVNGVLVPQLG